MPFFAQPSLRIALKSSASYRLPLAAACGFGLMLAGPAGQALANPSGGAVTTGSASVSTSSSKTSVNQKSEDVVIDWSSFNIGSGQTTQFYQPNAQAIAVNRVGGANASQILGKLDANGRVVLINGNGVLFGKGAQVNVGSLIATSTDGSDSDVLSGKFTRAGKQNASVVNNGAITAASGGVVALVAPNVSNTGTVNARLGAVALGAANKFTVDFSGDGLVSFAAQGDVNARASAINSGLLSGANVSMTAHAANGIATGIVNMSGIITAQGVQNVGGTIYLNAGNGTLTTTGTLNAAGVTGGGQIETSGETVNISGHVTGGKGGLWKVDPENLTIDSTAAGTIDGTLSGGTSVLEQTTSGAANGTGNQTAGAGDIDVESAMSWNSAATLTLDSYHSINIAAPITITGAGGLTLITNDGGSGGNYFFKGGNVAYTDLSPGFSTLGSLTINGTSYELVNTFIQLNQDVFFDNSASIAFANSYNASTDGTYSNSLVTTTFNGSFEGLGNTITNLTIDAPSAGNVGLFAALGTGGVVRDIGLVGGSVTGVGSANVGWLVGYNNGGTVEYSYATGAVSGGSAGGLVGYNNAGTVEYSYATGAVSGGNAGGLVGYNNAGTVEYSYDTGAVSGGWAGGLVGSNISGTIEDSYATGGVTSSGGGVPEVGGLVGDNAGTIEYSYATGTANGGNAEVGGLAGYNNAGTIEDSYATGAVTSSGGGGIVGGLVGLNASTPASLGDVSTIEDSYATGAVSGGELAYVGGLVGQNLGESVGVSTVEDSYATGAVSGGAYAGGLVGYDGGTVTNSYWDMNTSGVTNSSRGAGNVANDPGITGETTSALQGALPTGFSNTVWSTGTGLYPYLSWQYASTPQAVSGIAYSNGGGTVLQGGTVSTLVDGNALGTASTGANGYYYLLVAPGTISGSNAVLAYSSANGARVDTATDALDANSNVSGFDVWGNTLIAPTSDTAYSTASATSLQTQDASLIAQAVGANTDPTTGLTNYGYIATGTGFTIDQPLTLSNGLYVKTTGGNISVNDALTLPGSEGLALESSGALTIDAPINVTGAGALVLDYSTSALTNLSFGLTSSGFSGRVNYGTTDNGGTLSINGTPYTLLYSMSDMQNINASDAALVGNYALADSLDATGTTGWVPIGTAGNSFGGTFEGLGNTISNLIVDMPSVSGVGLFGYATGSVFRDLGVVGGSFTGADLVGGLVGENLQGTIANAYATGSVSGDSEVGGLVGNLDFLATITNAYATGAVSGSQDVGGLVGRSNIGTITNAYATGAVDDIGSGLSQYFGGLVGLVDDGGGITDAYATGAVMGSGSGISEYGGGLVGRNDGGIIDAYATGAVGGFRVVGGLAGVNDGGILDAYATGTVSGNAGVGGLVGGSTTGAVLTDGYWDTQTSGIGTDGGGAAPLTTAEMQGTFANMPGFAGPTWATGTGLFPYLSWQFASTPQVVSGFTVTSNGKTGVSGLDVSLLVNGNGVTPAIATSSGANGYYYLLLQPGTIANSGSPLFAYLTNGTPGNSFVGNALGRDGNLEIEEGQLRVKSGAASVTGLFRALNTAVGGATGADFLYTSAGGLASNVNLFLDDSAATFNINAALDVGTGTLWLYDPKGAISESGNGAITAGQLRGTSNNGVTLNGTNDIARLGPFTNTGSGGFSLTNAGQLDVTGAVNAGTGDLSLTTTANGIVIGGDLTAGGTVVLNAGSGIWQNANSSITAETLTGSANGTTRLQGANLIADLGAFDVNAANFLLTNDQTLTVTGTVGANVISLNATSGDLVDSGALHANTVTLVSSLGEVYGTGNINAMLLNVSADTGIDLDGTSNNIHRIGTRTTNSGPNVINAHNAGD